MSSEIQNRPRSAIMQMKSYLGADEIKKRLEETLGKRAGAFSNSIINVVRNSDKLQKCPADSIMSAAMVAATMNLPIDPALGQAAIVPYGNTAQFQIMYRGVLQLCIRSGMYQTIHCSEIYADELRSHNPITGEVKFHPVDQYKMRDGGDSKNVIGHYASFTLTTGFTKSDYMTHPQVMSHAAKYSKAYQYDIKTKKGTSAWSTDPVAMGNKTVLMRLLRKFGVMSIEMQDAFVTDSSFEAADAAADDTINGKTGTVPVDDELTPAKKTKTKKKTKKVESKDVTPNKDGIGYMWACHQCKAAFDEPKAAADGSAICPRCLSTNIEEQ